MHLIILHLCHVCQIVNTKHATRTVEWTAEGPNFADKESRIAAVSIFCSECPVRNLKTDVHQFWWMKPCWIFFDALYWASKSQQNSYLLHGDLWLGGHVLLGVAHTSSILVLGHGTHWGSSGRSTGRALAKGLGRWGEGSGNQTINKQRQKKIKSIVCSKSWNTYAYAGKPSCVGPGCWLWWWDGWCWMSEA